ncbi:MAG: 3-hydroxyacyl-ACP dehydratase FabZ [Rickettsiales bacterium]|nr:3-hydroxyacyl-ACP dehydratase FabZ [Rickettsiales bacterium]
MSEVLVINKDLPSYDVVGIQKLIPHRYPFLMIDRVVNVVTGQSIVGIKNVSINEPHFTGHFPNHPVMPGVLIVEAMAQTSAVLVMHTLGSVAHGKVVYFMSVEGSKFRKPVVPGDVLHIHCEAQKSRGNVWRFSGIAKVEGVKVAEGVYTAMIVDEKDEA